MSLKSDNGAERPDRRSGSVWRGYQELRRLIVSGQLPPGVRISEREVAERLGLSRTPVRSALHRLQQEGFVTSLKSGREQRLMVAPLTQDDGREIFLIVGHLEGMAARIAAELPTTKRRLVGRRLREINTEMAAAARARVTITRLFDLDQAFHAGYVEGIAGPRLVALHHAIKPQVERYARLYISALIDELRTSITEHRLIIRAIAGGDAVAAQQAVETNWQNAAGRLAQVIAEQGERGVWRAWDTGEPLGPLTRRHQVGKR